MRINLVTPFAEKDAAKALGARWDSAQKTWYVTNVTDLAPFLRWIPNPDRPMPRSVPRGTVTVSITVVDDCGCMVLPWDPCQHS